MANQTKSRGSFRAVLVAIIFLGAASAQAANHYVRAGAAGSANGNDWSNAYAALPASLVRGDVYYIAAGSYGARDFDDAHSGTAVITIKKAVAADHGTDTGWLAAYAGQAVFQSSLHFKKGYYVFDGQTRNESDWFDGAAYGFRVDHNNKDQNIQIFNQNNNTNNVTIKYVYVNAIVGNLPSTTIGRYAVTTDTQGGPINTGLVFSRMFVNGSNNVWLLRTTNGAILEYSASQNADGNSANHGEVVNLYYSADNAVIRYNFFRDEYVPNGSTAMIALTYSSGQRIYGNTFSNFRSGDGAIGWNSPGNDSNSATGGAGGIALAPGSGTNFAYNNVWTNCGNINISSIHDYNAFRTPTRIARRTRS